MNFERLGPVQSIVLILLFAMFSLSLWAQPPSANSLDCEVLFQTNYGRMIRMLALAGHISPEQLKEVIQQDRPNNPFRRIGKNPENVTFRRAIEREMKLDDAIASWPETKRAIVKLIVEIQKRNENEGDAKINTKKIFNPKLYVQSTHAKFHLTYNQITNQLIAWREAVASRANRSAYFTFDLETKKTTVGHVDKSPTVLVRKNGEVFTAGVNEKREIIVRSLNSKVSHVIAPFVTETNLELIELPNGQMLLRNSSSMSGTFLYDVSNPSNPRELLREADVEEMHHHMSAFHISEEGKFYFAAANRRGTTVYVLKNGALAEVGKINKSREPREGNWAYPPVLITDADEALYIGESVRGSKGYRVIKFENGIQEVVFLRPDIDVAPASAVFHWNASGDLILLLSEAFQKNQAHLINVLDRGVSDISIPVKNFLDIKPSWFTLPDGREVVAAIPFEGRPFVFAADTGSIIWQGPSVATTNSRPLWMKTPDGKIFLAFDTLDGVQIFDVWRGEEK